jgi:hypothetical protein
VPRTGELTSFEAPTEEGGCFVDVGGPDESGGSVTSSGGAWSATEIGAELVEAAGRGGDSRDGETEAVEAELEDDEGAIKHKRSR